MPRLENSLRTFAPHPDRIGGTCKRDEEDCEQEPRLVCILGEPNVRKDNSGEHLFPAIAADLY
jgi:hypothetical protein